jgi:hypothetical protein
MTKNLNNSHRSTARGQQGRSLFSRGAELAFPLIIVALGYVIGRQFFGL